MIEPASANSVIKSNLSLYLQDLENEWQADALVFVGPLMHPADDALRDAIESRQKPRRAKLVVVLETGGGYIEIAERAAQTMRFHYHEVEFVIPNYAMSAGTVLVMSGDAFWMDYYSILGPIDPQVERPDGRPVPALGYLAQYERLIEKSKTGDLTTAELAFLVEKFDPAELYRYEQERDLSITLLEQWLVKYKFKNWMQTETRKLLVDDAMRRARASEIGKALNETHRWHSHSRGLSIEVFLDVKKVVAANPGIDERKLQEGMEMLRKLRELGFKGAVYNIESPFARRRTKLSDSAKKAMRKSKSRR